MLLACVGNAAGAAAVESTGSDSSVDNRHRLKLFLAGDVMTGRGIDQILSHPSDPSLHEAYVEDARRYVTLAERKNGPIPKPADDLYIWGDALAVWDAQAPDVRVVNLETSITTSDAYWPTKGIHYRMHPGNIGCLTAAGLDCCVLANNHVMDWGDAGLEETLTTLHGAGIRTAGAGLNIEEARRPARLSVPDKGDVLVFGVAIASSGVPDGWSAERYRGGVHRLDHLSGDSAGLLAEHIAAERRPEDIVVLSIHWGGNWGYRIPAAQQQFARHLIDTGTVDIVHGHSSHHAKAVEYYRGKAIIYGCGDLLNDYEGIGGHARYRPWLAPMYFVTMDPRTRQVERIEIDVLRMLRFRLTTADAEDRQWLRARLNEVSEDYATEFDLHDRRLVIEPHQHYINDRDRQLPGTES